MNSANAEIEREVGALLLANVQMRQVVEAHEKALRQLAARLARDDIPAEIRAALVQAHPRLAELLRQPPSAVTSRSAAKGARR